MTLAAWMIHLLSRDGTLDRVEGALLLAGAIGWTTALLLWTA